MQRRPAKPFSADLGFVTKEFLKIHVRALLRYYIVIRKLVLSVLFYKALMPVMYFSARNPPEICCRLSVKHLKV